MEVKTIPSSIHIIVDEIQTVFTTECETSLLKVKKWNHYLRH